MIDRNIFYSTGIVFTTTEDQENDHKYYASLGKTYNAITLNSSSNKLYLNDNNAGVIHIFEIFSLLKVGEVYANYKVEFMKLINRELLVIENDNGTYYLTKTDRF